MINVIDDALISAIDKINVYLNNKGVLRAELLDSSSNYLPSGKGIPLTDLNKILDAIYAKYPSTLETLFKSHVIEITDSNVNREYICDLLHFSKVKTITKDKADKLDVINIEKGELFLDTNKNIALSVKTNTSKVVIKDMDAINGILDRLYAIGYSGIMQLTTSGKIVVDAKILSEYEFKDNKHLSKLIVVNDVDKITKVELNVKDDGTIDGKIKYNDNTESALTDLAKVNETIGKISQAKGKNLTELMSEGIVVCTSQFKKKYEIKDSKEYVERTKKKPVINLKTVKGRVILGLGSVAFLGGLAALIIALVNGSKGGKTNINNNNDTPRSKYDIDVNIDGQNTTFTLTDEDVMRLSQDSYYLDQNDYYEPEYRYSHIGSIIEDRDIDTQLDRIDDIALRREFFMFETAVVAEDYDIVKIISDMRNQVMNGSLEPKLFLDCVCPYIFEGKTSINGQSVKPFYELLPFGKYTINRMVEGVLQEDRKLGNYYNSTPENVHYNYDLVVETLESGASDERQIIDLETKTR